VVRHASFETPGQRTDRTPERVVRVRVASDPASEGVLIYDFDGDLFFGAAPDFQRFLDYRVSAAESREIKHIVSRLKRIRNPDVVALGFWMYF
jgi:SulP family sulfate permease